MRELPAYRTGRHPIPLKTFNFNWMKKRILIVLCILTGVSVSAQYFQTGQDPASIRWRQLDTQNFKLIYPDYYEIKAQKIAGYLETVYPFGSYSLQHNPRKFPVVLHTQTIESNGLVAWAPRRSEFFTTPHQTIYPQDWLQQLALHEFRHMVQIEKINSNVPVLMRLMFGEQATALIFGVSLPWWFTEGDAVVTETALSNYGRGREPSFLMEQQALLVEKGRFSYDKAYFGSYKHFVPNHYNLGYFLVGNLRAKYGNSLWEKLLINTTRQNFPMRKTLKKQTGLNHVKQYKAVFDSLHTVWQNEDRLWEKSDFPAVSPSNKFYTNYRHNHWLNDSVILSYKTAFDEPPSFVKISSNGEEKRIVRPGAIFDESVRYRDEWIVWSEKIPDLRWQHNGHSLIRMVHAETKELIEIHSQFIAVAPVISLDKTKVAVVESDFEDNNYLSVYRLPDGELLNRYQSPGNNYFFSPEWIDNDQIALIVLSEKGKHIETVNFKQNISDPLVSENLADIRQLRFSGNKLYFISSYSGKNSLYCFNFQSKEIELIYSPRFGVESPAISPDGGNIVLSDYTSDGFRLIKIQTKNVERRNLKEVTPADYKLAQILSEQEKGIPVFSDTLATVYNSIKYNKVAHFFNFHSWAPVNIDVNSHGIYPGLSLMSQNLLGTSETVLGYRRDLTEKTGRFTADYSFMGWYPVFNLNFSHGLRSSEFMLIQQYADNNGNIVKQDTVTRQFGWNDTKAGLNIHLPLKLDKGSFSRYLQPEVHYDFSYYSSDEQAPEGFVMGGFHSLGYRLYFRQTLRKSYLDMYPNFGFIFDGAYRHIPFGTKGTSNLAAAQSFLYLPGLMKTHGIRLYGGIQRKESNGNRVFSDVVQYARGWGRTNTTSVNTLASDYKMPLLYPDMNLLGLLYVRRIKASVFADYSRLKGNIYKSGKIADRFMKEITSVGTEITADVNLLRFYAPVDIGFRTSYLPEVKSVFFDILFSVDFSSF